MDVTKSATEAPARARAARAETGFTEALANWACSLAYHDIPARARRIAGLALFDWYAVAWAGAPEPAPRILRQTFAGVLTPAQPAHVIGENAHADTVTAALLNGTAGHVLDYDDVHNALPGHATAPVAPAVLALAEARGASGRDFLIAFAAGFEIACRMGVFAGPGLFRRGYHGSTTAGAIGAAAACARLLGADKTQTRRAFGLAATQAGGLQATVGTMAKCFNVGKAAQNGLMAALLAANGFECAENVLEAPRGYGAVFADGGAAEAALALPPGGWHLYRNLFKHHASCFMTHAPLEALKAVRARAKFGAEDVAGIVVSVEPHFHRIVLTPPPRTGLEAKFNLQFCLALALAGADTGAMASFDDATARRADLHALAARCTVETVPDMHFESATVEVRLRDGRSFAATHDSGEPEADLDRLEDRVRKKAAALLDAEKAGRLAGAFLALEAQPNVAMTIAELRG
jgi:2-methylcitrate dehydratase PrpD